MSVTVLPRVNQVVLDPENPMNAIPASMGLMKGDILVFRGENDVVRLPVGNDGQVLTADSSSVLGVKWATPS